MKRLHSSFSTSLQSPYKPFKTIRTIPRVLSTQMARSLATAASEMPSYHQATVGNLETFVLPQITEDNIHSRLFATAASKMPPHHQATVGNLEKFVLPQITKDNIHSRSLATAASKMSSYHKATVGNLETFVLPQITEDNIHSRSLATAASKMPPYHQATVGNLETFVLPQITEDNIHSRSLATAASEMPSYHQATVGNLETFVLPQITEDNIHSRSLATAASKMPPYHQATVGNLETFVLPQIVEDNIQSRTMAKAMIEAWRKTGIFQIQMTTDQQSVLNECFKTSKEYFQLPFEKKAKFVDDQSFAGYIASGEELTDGIADYSEIFTVTKDLPESDPRVQKHWPCHGPCPWPNQTYKTRMNQLMDLLGDSGEKLLKLIALGLGLRDPDTFLKLTQDGWHHMRILRFPQVDRTNGKGKKGRGIGSHTDYGLLVIAGQDDVGGLFVRPKVEGENTKNWEKSAAGLNESDEKWLFVPPVENTLTVFPGDMMQFLTNDFLYSTPHKVGLNTAERFAFAYFHEPNFNSVLEPLPGYGEKIHYGTHFTNMFMRCYPERVTTKRIHAESRLEVLDRLRNEAFSVKQPRV